MNILHFNLTYTPYEKRVSCCLSLLFLVSLRLYLSITSSKPNIGSFIFVEHQNSSLGVEYALRQSFSVLSVGYILCMCLLTSPKINTTTTQLYVYKCLISRVFSLCYITIIYKVASNRLYIYIYLNACILDIKKKKKQKT